MTRSRFLFTFALFVLAGRVDAQGDIPAQPPKLSEFRIEYYRPQDVSANFVYQAAKETIGSRLVVQADEGLKKIETLILVGDVLILHERPEQIDRMIRELTRAAEALRSSTAKPPALTSAHFRPRYLSLEDAERAVARPPTAKEGEAAAKDDRVTRLDGAGVLVLRDRAEEVDRMLALLQALDVEPVSITVECIILRAAAKNDDSVSADLAKNLAALTGATGFEVVSNGLVRTTVQGKRVILGISGHDDVSCELEFTPKGYDTSTDVLSLMDLSAQVRSAHIKGSQLIRTSTTLRRDESTVIGAAGKDSVYIVLRFRE